MNRCTVLLLATLAGCAQGKFYRDNTTQTDYQKDWQACSYEVRLATANYASGRPTANTTSGAVGQGIAEGIGQATVQRDLAIECMKTKGYVYR